MLYETAERLKTHPRRKEWSHMKTAAKVFIILSMIMGFWTVLPLIFGGIALSKMKKEKPSVGLSVCVILFCSMLGGIFLLCSREEEYR